MKRIVFGLGLASSFWACAGQSEDPAPAHEDPIVGNCPACSDNQICVNGACQDIQSNTTETCGPSNCAHGCCSDGHCVSGSSVNNCGSGGDICDVCSADQSCDLATHSCKSASCDSSNCANGCCDGSTCRQTPDDAHCGSGGQQCSACGSGEKCQKQNTAYQCVAQQGPSYLVTLLSASVNPKKPDGSNWDSSGDTGCFSCLMGCCPPDVYVSDTSQFAGLSIPKVVASNTATATWNLIIGKKDQQSLVGATVQIDLKDDDPSVLTDDVIGSCTTKITANDLSTGLLTLSPSRGCTGSVQSVMFSLSAN